MLVDPDQEGLDSDSAFVVVPRLVGNDTYLFGDKGPYQALRQRQRARDPLAGWDKYWKYGAIGVPDLLGFDKEKIQKAIQLAVDRHTDWYDSGYDDKMGWNALKNDQAYSPFVASSYEMSESDNFTSPGVTVKSSDPVAAAHKHWMFVFKVHKDNWFTPETSSTSREAGAEPRSMWFDETSFGDTGLANSEKAWDRMGTALEAELDSMLYLYNVPKFDRNRIHHGGTETRRPDTEKLLRAPISVSRCLRGKCGPVPIGTASGCNKTSRCIRP